MFRLVRRVLWLVALSLSLVSCGGGGGGSSSQALTWDQGKWDEVSWQ